MTQPLQSDPMSQPILRSVCRRTRSSVKFPPSLLRVSPLKNCSTERTELLIPGHETTASALTWTLYALARAPDVQRILRARLSSIQLPSDSSSPAISALDEVIHHDYLDHVVRESLRLHAPVSSTMRVVAKDGVIPVSRPFTDRRGRVCNVIRVKKGDLITIPIQAMNKSTSVYGEDARNFRPERWTDVELAKDQNINENEQARRRRAMVPGLWGNILTFGNGNPAIGNRACIGYRFALSESVLVFDLLGYNLTFPPCRW